MTDDFSNSLDDLMMDDAAAPVKVSDVQLGTISVLITEKLKLEEELEDLNRKVKSLTERVREISSVRIPEIFDGLGFSEIRLDDGRRVTIKTDYACSITENNKVAAFSELRQRGLDSVIKNEVKVPLGKDSVVLLKKLTGFCEKLKLKVEQKESVHPQTLKALVREQVEAGSPLNEEVFSIFKVRSTIIK
jgi:hypothetical protein